MNASSRPWLQVQGAACELGECALAVAKFAHEFTDRGEAFELVLGLLQHVVEWAQRGVARAALYVPQSRVSCLHWSSKLAIDAARVRDTVAPDRRHR